MFGQLIKAEWVKLTTNPSFYWILGTIATLQIIISVSLGAFGTVASGEVGGILFFGSILGFMVFAGIPVLGTYSATNLTAEYSSGMIKTTFLAAPQRIMVIFAKFLVLSATFLAYLLMTVGITVIGMMAIIGGFVEYFTSDIIRYVIVLCIYLVGLVAIALGFAGLIRHSAGSVIAVLALIWPVFSGLLVLITRETSVAAYTANGAIINMLSTKSEGVTGWPMATVIFLIWSTAVFALGVWRISSRDT